MKLTADEIKLVVFLVLALLVGAITKYYRHQGEGHLPPVQATGTAGGEPTPLGSSPLKQAARGR